MSTPPPPRLPAGLYVLCDDTVHAEVPLLQKARWLLGGRPAVLQLRLERTLPREAVPLCREVVALCRAAGVPCIINDHVDWALVSGADGVHLGEQDLPVPEARALLGPGRLIGATVRDAAGLRRAREEGADHVGLGPVFQTRTKEVGLAPLGAAGLARVCAAAELPVVAIAGISAANIPDVARAGAHCAAVASAPFAAGVTAEAVAATVRALRTGFDNGAGLRTL